MKFIIYFQFGQYFSDMTDQTRQMTTQVMVTRLRSVTQGRTITQEQLNTVIVQPGAASSSDNSGAVSDDHLQ